jgi:ABC-type amino acid transport substrate-binding protein
LTLDRLEVSYLQVTPANRIEVIEEGRAQLECGSTTNNAARRQQVDFTIPHFITGASLLVKADSPIDRIDHPVLRKVVSTRNTTPLTALRRIDFERMLRLEIIEADDHERRGPDGGRGQGRCVSRWTTCFCMAWPPVGPIPKR